MDRKTLIEKQKVKALIHKIGLKYNLSDEAIKNLTSSPYLFAHGIIKELDLDGIETEEDLNSIPTNFYFKGLCKLYIPFPRVDRRNKQKETYKRLNKKRWTKKA